MRYLVWRRVQSLKSSFCFTFITHSVQLQVKYSVVTCGEWPLYWTEQIHRIAFRGTHLPARSELCYDRLKCHGVTAHSVCNPMPQGTWFPHSQPSRSQQKVHENSCHQEFIHKNKTQIKVSICPLLLKPFRLKIIKLIISFSQYISMTVIIIA